jgi:glycerol-3-phosphate dehydrogenase (NAD(P)+)
VERKPKVAILPASGWGTAFSIIASERTQPVLYFRSPQQAEAFNNTRQNKNYLPGKDIPENVWATSNLKEALEGAQILVLASPSRFYRSNWEEYKNYIDKNALEGILSLSKGLEAGTHSRMSQILLKKNPKLESGVAVLSGPNLASEISECNKHTSADIASSNYNFASRLRGLFEVEGFGVNTTNDVIGVEYGGAFKNIIAMAVGMSDALNRGSNARGEVIYKGLAEMVRLGVALGAKPETFYGASGLGDLEASCSGKSRNYMSGTEIAVGVRIREIFTASRTTEGLYTVKEATALAKRAEVQVPIIQMVNDVVYQGLNPREGFESLKAA